LAARLAYVSASAGQTSVEPGPKPPWSYLETQCTHAVTGALPDVQLTSSGWALPAEPPLLLGCVLEVAEGAGDTILTNLGGVMSEDAWLANPLHVSDRANGSRNAPGISRHHLRLGRLHTFHHKVLLPLMRAANDRRTGLRQKVVSSARTWRRFDRSQEGAVVNNLL